MAREPSKGIGLDESWGGKATRKPSYFCVKRGRAITSAHKIPLTRLEERIIWALVARSPKPSEKDDLIDICWGDHEDGGPLSADGVIRTVVSRIRAKLAPTPWGIASYRDRGYVLRYRGNGR